MLVAAIVILAGVVVVASGRGGEMAPEYPDYPPMDLGPVTAADVALLRPPSAAWGYNMRVTDVALETIARAMTERDVTISALQQEVADLRAELAPDGIRGPGPQEAAADPDGPESGPGSTQPVWLPDEEGPDPDPAGRQTAGPPWAEADPAGPRAAGPPWAEADPDPGQPAAARPGRTEPEAAGPQTAETETAGPEAAPQETPPYGAPCREAPSREAAGREAGVHPAWDDPNGQASWDEPHQTLVWGAAHQRAKASRLDEESQAAQDAAGRDAARAWTPPAVRRRVRRRPVAAVRDAAGRTPAARTPPAGTRPSRRRPGRARAGVR